jgi:hypothetical protein
MRFDVTTDASPGQVLQALTDFTERRPRIWYRTLDPKDLRTARAARLPPWMRLVLLSSGVPPRPTMNIVSHTTSR